MAKNKLSALLDPLAASVLAVPARAKKLATSAPPRIVHRPGDVNISAYFPAQVKAGLRQVQAKSGKSIKACLAEGLQMLFRKYNVPVSGFGGGE